MTYREVRRQDVSQRSLLGVSALTFVDRACEAVAGLIDGNLYMDTLTRHHPDLRWYGASSSGAWLGVGDGTHVTVVHVAGSGWEILGRHESYIAWTMRRIGERHER